MIIFTLMLMFVQPIQFEDGRSLPFDLISGYEVCEATVENGECVNTFFIARDALASISEPFAGSSYQFEKEITPSMYGADFYYSARTKLIDGSVSAWSNSFMGKYSWSVSPAAPLQFSADIL